MFLVLQTQPSCVTALPPGLSVWRRHNPIWFSNSVLTVHCSESSGSVYPHVSLPQLWSHISLTRDFIRFLGSADRMASNMVYIDSWWVCYSVTINQETTEFRKQPIRTRYWGHVTHYQPIRDQYFLIRSVPVSNPSLQLPSNLPLLNVFVFRGT